MPDQSGRTAIVTGPTLGGIGYHTALALARRGAHVVLAGCDLASGEEALAALRRDAPGCTGEFMPLDLASPSSIVSFSQAFLAKGSPLHLLINNAGTFEAEPRLSEQGLEMHFATNHLGHYLLTRLLLQRLLASAPSRIVTVSSFVPYGLEFLMRLAALFPAALRPSWLRPHLDFADAASGRSPEKHLFGFFAYARSKLANLLFARALGRRLRGTGARSFACNPGYVASNMPGQLLKQYRLPIPLGLVTAFTPMLLPEQGAVTPLYLATAEEVDSAEAELRFYRPQARHAALPGLVTESLEEELWDLSEQLVKPFLSASCSVAGMGL